eukprot:scaffold29823_cov129-Isochrysis_galbana.AAC.1
MHQPCTIGQFALPATASRSASPSRAKALLLQLTTTFTPVYAPLPLALPLPGLIHFTVSVTAYCVYNLYTTYFRPCDCRLCPPCL